MLPRFVFFLLCAAAATVYAATDVPGLMGPPGVCICTNGIDGVEGEVGPIGIGVNGINGTTQGPRGDAGPPGANGTSIQGPIGNRGLRGGGVRTGSFTTLTISKRVSFVVPVAVGNVVTAMSTFGHVVPTTANATHTTLESRALYLRGTPLTSSTSTKQYVQGVSLSNGYGAFVWQESNHLWYVRALDANGEAWITPLTVDASGTVGAYCSITLVDGHPAIAYFDSTTAAVRYVRALDAFGDTWPTPPNTLVGAVQSSTSTPWVSLWVVNGNPAIVFQNTTSTPSFKISTLYVRASDIDGASWPAPPVVVETSASNSIGVSNQLRVVNGVPAFAYLDVANTRVRYVNALDVNGTTWNTSLAVDTAATTVRLEVVNGQPALVYQGTGTNVYFVRALDAQGVTWGTPQQLANTISQSPYPTFLIVNSRLYVSYWVSSSPSRLRVSLDANGDTWSDTLEWSPYGDGPTTPNGFGGLLQLGAYVGITGNFNNIFRLLKFPLNTTIDYVIM